MNADNLSVLGEFYRRKRESLLPESLGLPKSVRRSRTPGLRREDVAYLAGVSAVWYSKIERGKSKGVSATTIEALNTALQLTKDEVGYVNRLLSSDNSPCPVPQCMRLSSYTHRVLDLLNPLPALVLNDYLDIIYANDAFIKMCGLHINELPDEERNYVYLAIMDKVWRKFLSITDKDSLFILFLRLTGILRSNQASRPTDKRMKDLIAMFNNLSPEFEKAWQQNTIQQPKLEHEIHHAALGQTLYFSKQILYNGSGESSGRITIYHPQNESDYKRLAALLD